MISTGTSQKFAWSWSLALMTPSKQQPRTIQVLSNMLFCFESMEICQVNNFALLNPASKIKVSAQLGVLPYEMLPCPSFCLRVAFSRWCGFTQNYYYTIFNRKASRFQSLLCRRFRQTFKFNFSHHGHGASGCGLILVLLLVSLKVTLV